MKFKFPFWIVPSILSIVLSFAAYLITKETSTFTTVSAFFSMIFLGLTLIPGNLGNVLPSSMNTLKKTIFKAIAKRRDFGIMFGVTILAHAIFAELKFYNLNILKGLTPDIIPGGIVLFLVAIMLITSNYSVQRIVKRWKLIHSVIWFALPVVVIHGIFSAYNFKGELGVVNIISILLLLFAFAKFFIGGDHSIKLGDILLIIFGTAVGAIFSLVSILQITNDNYLNSFNNSNIILKSSSSSSLSTN
ncbi:MAG: hypothetical protein WCO33_04445 [bacterium]